MVLYHSNLPRSEWNLGTRTHDDCSCDQQHEKHSDFHQHPQTKHHKLVGLIQVGFESQDPDRMGNKHHGECGHIEEQPTTKQLDVSQACTHGNTTTFQMYPWWCWNCVTFFKSLQKCWCDTSSSVIFSMNTCPHNSQMSVDEVSSLKMLLLRTWYQCCLMSPMILLASMKSQPCGSWNKIHFCHHTSKYQNIHW